MSTCARCPEQHGLVDGLCSDCRRWDEHFTVEERVALHTALERQGKLALTPAAMVRQLAYSLAKGQRPVEGYASGAMSPGPDEPRSSHAATGPGQPPRASADAGDVARPRKTCTCGWNPIACDDDCRVMGGPRGRPGTGLHLRVEWPPVGPLVIIRGRATFADGSTFAGVMDVDLGLLLRLFAGFDPVQQRFREALERLHKDALREQFRLAAEHDRIANDARDRAYELGVAWGEAHTLG